MRMDVALDTDCAVSMLPIISMLVDYGINKDNQWKRVWSRDGNVWYTPLDMLINERVCGLHPKWNEILTSISIKNGCDVSRVADTTVIPFDYLLRLYADLPNIVDCK